VVFKYKQDLTDTSIELAFDQISHSDLICIINNELIISDAGSSIRISYLFSTWHYDITVESLSLGWIRNCLADSVRRMATRRQSVSITIKIMIFFFRAKGDFAQQKETNVVRKIVACIISRFCCHVCEINTFTKEIT
jgi:hypothetical protein